MEVSGQLHTMTSVRLGEPQSRSEPGGGGKSLFNLSEIEHKSLCLEFLARRYTDWGNSTAFAK
jgi:hypothetical protein